MGELTLKDRVRGQKCIFLLIEEYSFYFKDSDKTARQNKTTSHITRQMTWGCLFTLTAMQNAEWISRWKHIHLEVIFAGFSQQSAIGIKTCTSDPLQCEHPGGWKIWTDLDFMKVRMDEEGCWDANKRN